MGEWRAESKSVTVWTVSLFSSGLACIIVWLCSFHMVIITEFSGGLFWWNKVLATIHLALALPPQLSPKQNARSSKTRQLAFLLSNLNHESVRNKTQRALLWELERSWKLGCEVCCLPRPSPSRRGTWRCVGLVVLLPFLPKQKHLKDKIQVLTQILFHSMLVDVLPLLIQSLKARAWGGCVVGYHLWLLDSKQHRVIALVHRKFRDHNRYTIDALLEA